MVDGRFTEEQMKAFSLDAVPVLEQFLEIAKKNGINGYLRIYSSGEGYLTIEGEGLQGWELRKFNGEYKMSYNKVVPLIES